ncbi:hypothetical protein TWF694_003716 [Orbilia ellipsospora]|uniref:F-box domain-containing protein n=1 Tax=Orbilia ellipsospora TaxID=2528407 RepID=A0AAV9WZD2_9PEZI
MPGITIVDLPVEVLRMIFSYLYRRSLHAVFLTCPLFYAVAAEYFHETLILESDILGINYDPFLSTRLPEEVRKQIRFVKALRFIPYRGSDKLESRRRNQIEHLMKLLMKYGNFSFERLQSISFSSPDIFNVRNGFIPDIVNQFPQTNQLSIPYTINSITDPEHPHKRIILTRLRDFSFDVSWPEQNGDISRVDLSLMWDLINTNARTLECLRIGFGRWDPNTHKNLNRDYSDGSRGYLAGGLHLVKAKLYQFLEHLAGPGTPTYRPQNLISPILRPFFPMIQSQWPEQLSLKVLQMEMFPFCSYRVIYRNTNFLRPEILEVLSLVYCSNSFTMVLGLSRALVSLRCLQVVEAVDYIENLEKALLQLPRPLEALFVAMGAGFRGFDYNCLAHHQESLKVLYLWNPPGYGAFTGEKICQDSESKYGRVGRVHDFSSWPGLEELAIHEGNRDLSDLFFPPSLKFLNLINTTIVYKSHVSSNDPLTTTYKSRLLNGITKQIAQAGRYETNLEAIAVSCTRVKGGVLPLASFRPIITMAVKIEENASMRDRDQNLEGRVAIEMLELEQFVRRFPEMSTLQLDCKPCGWIDRFL